MGKIAEVQEVTIDLLIPYVNNAKIHSEEQVTRIASSIREFGFLSPVLVDRDHNIIAGHGRVMAAKKLKLKKVPCVYIEGLTDVQRKAYILADNRLSEMADWDTTLVAAELQALSEEGFDVDLTGFSVDDQIIDNEEIEELDIGVDLADAGAAPETDTKSGDLWILGGHRLLVGDSTSFDDVEKLMGGVEADLLETDPPYNVAVSNASGDTIANDDMKDDEFMQFLRDAFTNAFTAMRPGAAFYIWHADSNGHMFRNACLESGLTIKQNLIWVKNHFTLGRQDYQWRHEPCLYGWKEGASHYFSEKRNISTIIMSRGDIHEMSREELVEYVESLYDCSSVAFEDKPLADDMHPTMKPIALIEKQIKNSSKEGDVVLDLFGGSGTTLLACETLKRRCFCMEYDPKYADVIIKRWEELTGKKAELVTD